MAKKRPADMPAPISLRRRMAAYVVDAETDVHVPETGVHVPETCVPETGVHVPETGVHAPETSVPETSVHAPETGASAEPDMAAADEFEQVLALVAADDSSDIRAILATVDAFMADPPADDVLAPPVEEVQDGGHPDDVVAVEDRGRALCPVMFPFSSAADAFRILNFSRLDGEFVARLAEGDASWCEFIIHVNRRAQQHIELRRRHIAAAYRAGSMRALAVVRQYFAVDASVAHMISAWDDLP